MIVRGRRAIEFACHSAACAPHNGGGSLPGRRSGDGTYYPRAASSVKPTSGTMLRRDWDNDGTYQRGRTAQPVADVDSLFKGAPKIVAPFPSAGRRKGESKLPPQEAINEALRNPKLTAVDPKTVKTQQGFVTREGVAYYLTPKYKQTGETYADPTDRGNRFPMLWKKPNGDMVIMSGNHRFTAALIEGRTQDAIVVET